MSVVLEWAYVGGVVTPAASFVGVQPKDRPRGVCPCCDEAIVWKAGDVVSPHVAHCAGSACAATNPETAAHINAKMNVARVLGVDGVRVSILAPCPACGQGMAVPWRVAWASVRVECRVGRRVPDVALLDAQGRAVAAVEVAHSHRVDAEKAADLAASGLPWVEVSSADALAWSQANGVTTPLPALAADAAFLASVPLCRHCEAERARREAERQRAAAEAERARSRALVAEYYEQARRRLEPVRRKQLREPLPSLRIAVNAAVSLGGDAVAACCVVGSDKPVRTQVIEGPVTWQQAMKFALLFAAERLRQVAPGKRAALYTNAACAGSQTANLPMRGEWVDPDDWVSILTADLRLALAEGGLVALHPGGDARVMAALDRAKKVARALLDERCGL